MKHICPNCGTKFSAQEAICEDWRNPRRKFGCPNCKVWLKHADHSSELKKNLWFMLAIVAAVVVQAIIKELEPEWLSYGYTLVVGLCIVAFILVKYRQHGKDYFVRPKWGRSSLKVVEDSDENV